MNDSMGKRDKKEEIGETIRGIIARQFCVDIEEITDDKNIYESFNVDSLERIQIVFDLESELGIDIGDEEFANLRTVGDIIEMVANKMT